MTVQDYIRGTTAVKIADSIEQALLAGRLLSGDLLPPIRDLALRLGVSPATVAAAYRLLATRGVVAGDGRRGTRIVAPPPPGSAWSAPVPPGTRDLASGNPDPGLLPPLAPALARIDPRPHLYGGPLNLEPLVDWARTSLAKDGVEAREVAVTAGGLDGMERVLREHLRPGDRVAVEDPCFPGILELVRGLGLEAAPVPLDDEGPRPEALERALARGVKALVLVPRAQNPTGAALTDRRAADLRRLLAREPDLLVVEDDHAGPVSGVPLVTLTPGRARWAFVRSVSKWLGPDLRLALVAADPMTLARVEARRALGVRWVSHLLQQAALRLATGAGAVSLLRRASDAYGRRRSALLDALAARGIEARGRSGLNVWVPVPDEGALVQRLLAAGYAVRAGERFRIASGPGIRVTTAALAPDEAPRLAQAIAEALAPAGTTSGA